MKIKEWACVKVKGTVCYTCKIKKLAQPPQLAMSSTVPSTQFCSEGCVLLPLSWWVAACPFMNWRAGPLYKVITIAPETVTAVPTTLATLGIFLKFTVSNLVATLQEYNMIRHDSCLDILLLLLLLSATSTHISVGLHYTKVLIGYMLWIFFKSMWIWHQFVVALIVNGWSHTLHCHV